MRAARGRLLLVLLSTLAGSAGAAPPSQADAPTAQSQPAPPPADNGGLLLREDAPTAQPPPSAAVNPAAPAPTAAARSVQDTLRTFANELLSLGLSVNWSGLGAVVYEYYPGQLNTFDTSAFHPILSAEIGQSLHTEVEFEIDPSGVMAHYAILDYIFSRALTVRAGKFLVPIGQFNEVLHPVFRWDFVSYPLMFNEVIPGIWSDYGVQLRGAVGTRSRFQFEYAGWVSNGLGGQLGAASTGMNPSVMHMFGTVEPGYLNSLNTGFLDNNADKAVGARVGALALDRLRFDVSGYTGALDNAGAQRLSILDVDGSYELGEFLFRAELARSFVGRDKAPLRFFEQGAYFSAAWRHDRSELAARFDYADVLNFPPTSSTGAGSSSSTGSSGSGSGSMGGMSGMLMARRSVLPLADMGSMGGMGPVDTSFFGTGSGLRHIERQVVVCYTYHAADFWSLRGEVGYALPLPWLATPNAMGMRRSSVPNMSVMSAFYF